MKNIYIFCPANTVTGGPELLHQLNFRLNLLGYKSKMKYVGEIKELSPVADRYRIYNPDYVDYVEDLKENCIIVPEIYTNELKKYKNAQKIIWWLSVDNYFVNKNTIKYKLKSLNGLRDFNFKNNYVIHLAQSKYAIEFLKKNKVDDSKIFYLSDYLNDKFIENSLNNFNKKKKNQVLYNPKKGFEFTKKLIEKGKDIKWIPLINLSIDEMSELMQTSKVYIDFGNHPGKDRIPREAAISGCCIITGTRGSAKYYEDIAIDDKYKFNDINENIDNILSKIRNIFDNYKVVNKEFNQYRLKIMEEKNIFENDVKSIFNTIIK